MKKGKMIKTVLIGILVLLGGISIGGWHMMVKKQEATGFGNGVIVLDRPAGAKPGEIGVYMWPLYKATDEGTFEIVGYSAIEPYGWTVGPNGDIYIADTFNHRIQRFTPEGEFVAVVGSKGRGLGQFLPEKGGGPKRIEVDEKGNIYVDCGCGNGINGIEDWRSGVVKFSPEGKFLFSTVQTIGEKGKLIDDEFWVRNGLIYLQGEGIGPRPGRSYVKVLRVVDAETGALVREHPLYKQPKSEWEPIESELMYWVDRQGRVYFWDRMEREGNGVRIRIRRHDENWQEDSFSFVVTDTPEGDIHFYCRFVGEDNNGDFYIVDTFKGSGGEADYVLKIRWDVGVIFRENLQALMSEAGINSDIYEWSKNHARVDRLGYLYLPFWDKKATTYKIIRFEQK